MQFSIQTDRLLLRDIREEDAQAMFEMDRDPDVHRYLGNKPVTKIGEVEEVIRYIQQQYKDHGIGRWAVIERATGNFIGWSGLKFMTEEFNGQNNFYDLGYRFIKKYWGLGYATETALASLEFGFQTMHLK
jgi:RimJ/RimL family protein N-acetyltransferase